MHWRIGRTKTVRRALIGMVEIGTLNTTLAEALQRKGIVADSITWIDNKLDISGDARRRGVHSHPLTAALFWRLNALRAALIPYHRDSMALQHLNRLEHAPVRLLSAIRALFVYDTFIFVYGETLFPLNLDMPLLGFLGKRIVVIFNGCDVRSRAAVLPLGRQFTYCIECTLPCVDKEKRRKALAAERYADLILAMPEYAQYLRDQGYEFLWLPINLDSWQPAVANNRRLRVVHAPSVSQLKGTRYVEKAVQQLHDDSYEFDFITLAEKTHAQVRDELEHADIIVDQLLYGWYGLLAIEAMALQKCVVAYLSDECVKSHLPHEPIPVLNANPVTIYQVLREAIENEDLRTQTAQNARSFVERYHDSEHIADQLLDALNSL